MVRQGLWFAALLGVLLLCFTVSWWLQAKLHYGYSLWYDVLSIEQHIATYGPQNQFKMGFETLGKAEHLAAFQAISQAVHQQGSGLADIHYLFQNHSIALLTADEIVHLQDVANLIDKLNYISCWVALITLALLLFLWRAQVPLRLGKQVLYLALTLGLSVIAILAIGAEKVFYQLHIWIFPPQHPWFFYYQESLMSTMMKAPDLFAAIALAILFGALAIFAPLLIVLAKTQVPK